MRWDTHDETRKLIALGEGVSDTQQAWLRAHLEDCEACLCGSSQWSGS